MSHTFNIDYQFGSVLPLNHECGIVFLVDTATQYQLGCDDVRLFVPIIYSTLRVTMLAHWISDFDIIIKPSAQALNHKLKKRQRTIMPNKPSLSKQI